MVRITKVYTKLGDKGQTSLAGDHRVAKTCTRIAVLGDLDELNAVLGFAVSAILSENNFQNLVKQCQRIQNQLFNLGAQISVLLKNRHENTPVITVENIELLENEIDQMNLELTPLTSFILPGGGEAATRFHLARTVCRRLERVLVQLQQEEGLDGVELPYINRLSDWFFVVARFVSIKTGQKELLWEA